MGFKKVVAVEKALPEATIDDLWVVLSKSPVHLSTYECGDQI